MRLTELELIQTQMVARHGIRYPTEGNIQDINGLLKRLKPFEELLPLWMRNYTLPYNRSVAGELAVAGKFELWELGVRSLARSGHVKRVMFSKDNYRIAHTHVKRTRDSAIAFVDSFFENPEDVEYIEYPKNTDFLLRFFDQCARYQREHSFGLKRESIEFSPKDLMAVQSACAFDIALYHHKHQWCSLMSMTFIHSLDYLDDLEQFYWIGAGYKINYEMAAVLLRELFDTMKGRVNGSNTLAGNFFFAHAETTLPLVTLMGYGDRSLLLANATKAEINSRGFRTSILSPFGANIEFRLFKRKSGAEEFYVQILANEKKAKVPGCERVFCKLSELEQQWDYYLKTYDFQKDSPPPTNNSAEEVRNANVQGDKKPREDEIAQVFMPNAESSAVYEPKATDTPLSIPLGSVVELKLDYICATSAAEVEYLKEFAIAGQVSVRAYPVQNTEMKCQFDIDILEVQALPSNVSEGDSISIQLRIAQSNWKTELPPAKVALSGSDSKTLVRVGKNASTTVCWAPKDRSFPVLEVFVYIQRRQQNRMSMASRASLASTSNVKRRQIPQRTNEGVAPALVATGSLNLNSFFSQQNVSVRADLQLDVEKAFVENGPTCENATEKVAVLSRLRASSSLENGSKSPGPLESSNYTTQSVKGDVCIHLLQACGSVFRKADSLSSYYVSISCGSEEILSSCCPIDDANTVSWNQQIALPIANTGPPVIRLTLYHRAVDSISPPQHDNASQQHSDDQIVGYLTLPTFPSVLEEDHLLQLEVPFGMPPSSDSTATMQNNDLHYYKRGMLTLEMQFLPSEQLKLASSISSEVYELVIYRVRGNLQDSSTTQRPSGLAKHVFIDVSIMVDRGGTTEELAVGTTDVISLSPSGLTEVGMTVDLSNPMVAATLSTGINSVLVGRIRDLVGNNYGRVHLPLRKDWKERLVNCKKQVWYPVCVESNNAGVNATKDAVQMSLKTREQSCPIAQFNVRGKFHVNICEAILTSGFESSNLMKLGKYGGANNRNGYIDRKEFTNVFVDHLEDMMVTSDGQKLMHLLFGVDKNQDSSISPAQEQITALFSVMDTNRDNEIEWSEYLRFLQQRQQELFATTEEIDENPAIDIPEVKYEQKQELRRKNREDGRTAASNSADHSAIECNQDEIPPEKMREVMSRGIHSKQYPAAPKRLSKISSSEEKLLKLQYSNQEQNRLQQQITSLETILTIERRRYAELAADRQALMRSYQQLHLKHQNEIIQEQTKTKWMKQTIERQQQQLEEREKVRQNQNQASIVLQSTFRSRLEQKRYQGLKLQRVNAAIAIQCMVRRVKAKKQLRELQELDRVAKQCIRAASQMQRFIRFQLYRKERALLVEARELSAMILQKNARRMIACAAWRGQKLAVLKLQCWVRQRLAMKNFKQIHGAVLVVKKAVLGWYPMWKYAKIKASTCKIQTWWRRASKKRSAYFTLLEAAHCIQSVWKRRSARKWFEREWQRQEKYLAHLEAAICIQAAWKGRQQHVLNIRSQEGTPWLDDDSTVEALLYNLVAMVEADVVIPATSEHSFTVTVTGDQNVSPSAESLEVEEPSCTEYPFASSKPDDVPVVGDGTVSETNVIVAVLNDLVNAVTRATDVGGDVRGESNGLHASNSDREDEIGNPSCPETEQNIIITESGGLEIDMVSGEDITDNSSNQAANGSDVQEGGLDAPDCSDFRIIHNLIENLKELVTLSAVTEGATTHTQPESQVPDSTLDDIDEKAAEFDTTSLPIASEPTVSDVKAILRQQNADEGMPMQDVVSSETSRDDTSTTIDQAQQPLAEAFNTDAAVDDFAIPDDSDDESSIRHSSDGEDSGGSSVDSTDLMMEADAMTTMPDIPESAGSKSARHTRKTTRMDSSVLLADLDQLNAREDPTTPLGN
ncbi:hypothetical protein PI124_g17816 [Phytophthora idaei]|nr:hypothetical protein PI124_g17816 [Phytophthora idaei]